MEQLKEIVLKRLGEKGIDSDMIPCFIRNLVNSDLTAGSDLNELNRRLQILGWNEFELDDHTFRLIEAAVENNSFSTGLKSKNL